MKKILILFLAILIIIASLRFGGEVGSASQSSIASKIIRFHVIANSDRDVDQNLKLKVKDKILSFTSNILSNCKDIEASRKLLRANDSKIKAIAEQVIKANGYSYEVKTELGEENFPVKSYGDITLPQGSYEAYRVIIGSGKGKNWWCVMFPPLCFVDVTKGVVERQKTVKEMKGVLNEDEFSLVDNSPSNINSGKQSNTKDVSSEEGIPINSGGGVDRSKIVFKSKIFEMIKSIFS